MSSHYDDTDYKEPCGCRVLTHRTIPCSTHQDISFSSPKSQSVGPAHPALVAIAWCLNHELTLVLSYIHASRRALVADAVLALIDARHALEREMGRMKKEQAS